MNALISDKHIHDGHRQRMKSKLSIHGQRIFDTYELLEMLLYYIIPYKDTNPISKRLLAAFGSLDGVLSAPREALESISGIGKRGAEFISSVNELKYILGGEILPDTAVMNTYEKIGSHFLDYFKDKPGYNVAMAMFDNNMSHIETCSIVDKDYDSSAVRPSLFIGRAIRNKAAVVITAHNHPYGPAFPSLGDRATNNALKSALEAVGVTFLDHYLVSGNEYVSIADYKLPVLSQTPGIKEFLDGKSSHEEALLNANRQCDGQISGTRNYSTADWDLFVSLIGFAAKGKPVEEFAHRLLSRYRTIENVLCADITELSALSSESVAVALKIYAYITSRRVTDGFEFGVRHSDVELADYFKALYIGVPVETVYAMLLDKQGRAMSCEFVSEGTVSASELVPRKLIQIAMSAGASSLVLAHNHPLGNATPSKEDRNMTANLAELLEISRLRLAGHVVISGQTAEMIDYSISDK